MITKKIVTPIQDDKTIKMLTAGDPVFICGRIITARDMAHKRLCALIEEGRELPLDLKGRIIFYAGPTPARPRRPIGAIGPTTASRMDVFAPKLFELGVKGTIGKGYRSKGVIDALIKYGAVSFAAIGGIAALLAKTVKSSRIIAYEELGPEAIYELEVEDFPAIVAYDSYGRTIYPEIKPDEQSDDLQDL